MDKSGEIEAIWTVWLGPDTTCGITREEHVQPLSAITFTPFQ